jgi:hypothetical protein
LAVKPAVRCVADRDDLAGGDVDVLFRVDAVLRVDQPAAFDVYLHS